MVIVLKFTILKMVMFRLVHLFFALGFLSFTFAIPLPSDVVAATQNTDKLVIPAMARNAGGSWKSELAQGKDSKPKNNETQSSINSDQEPDPDYYNDGDEEEIKCKRDEYYHARGKQCVPIQCPGGNRYRNRENGECMWDGNRRNHGWNRSPYVSHLYHSRSTWWPQPRYRSSGRTGFKRG